MTLKPTPAIFAQLGTQTKPQSSLYQTTQPNPPLINPAPSSPVSPINHDNNNNDGMMAAPQVAEIPFGRITTLLCKGQDNVEHPMLDDLSKFARLKSSFHPGIISRTPKELVTNVVIHCNTEDQEFGIGKFVNPVENLLSPLTHSLF